MTTKRLRIALAIFVLMGGLAGVLLRGEVRLVVWIFLAGLGLKSWIVWQKERMDGEKHH
ncbi:MAG: hypothetical protein JJE04_21735 [Acidobacteriia bacterium]|nr:hypothetical protein [Terriglobia bacterium]